MFCFNIAHKGVCDEVYKILWFCGRFITAQKIDFLATGLVGGGPGHKAFLKRAISPGPMRQQGSRTLFVRCVGWGLDLEGPANESEKNPRHRASGLSRMRLGEWVEAWMAAIVSRTVLAFCRINFFGKSGSSFSK